MDLYLLEHLQRQRQPMIKKFQGLASKEIIEDCISKVAERLMLETHEIAYPQSWLYMTVRNEVLNYKRQGKNNVSDIALAKIASPCMFELLEDEQEEAWQISRVMDAVATLTKGQKRAVYSFLETGRVTNPELGVVNTQKALYLQAIRALRVRLMTPPLIPSMV